MKIHNLPPSLLLFMSLGGCAPLTVRAVSAATALTVLFISDQGEYRSGHHQDER